MDRGGRWRSGGVVLGVLVALVAGCASGLEQQEESYRYRLEKLDGLAAKAPEPLRAEAAATRQKLVATYDALSKEEGPRGEGLGTVCQGLSAALAELEVKLAAAGQAAVATEQAAAAVEGTRLRAQLTGRWQGGGVDLAITADGHVKYERKSGAITKQLEGTISRCAADGFDVSVFGISTTFKVQTWPREVGGSWTMRVDETDLVRSVAP